MVSIIKHKTKTKKMPWDELREKAIAGKIKANDQICLEFDGKPLIHDVIGVDVDMPIGYDPKECVTITIQMHDLVMEERPFDTKGDWGSNVWETSEIRAYLKSEEFLNRYADLEGHLAAVKKKNNSGDDTNDIFFLLSVDEYDPVKTPYPYYRNRRNRVKFNPEDGETEWHWTRSAYRGSSSYAWYVNTTGYLSSSNASSTYRCAPACVLIFPI